MNGGTVYTVGIMKIYNTEKRTALIEFMKRNCQRPMTVGEICRAMLSDGGSGKSTVYRLISRLVEEGELRRISPSGSGTYAYQYNIEGSCRSHMHLRCTVCGELIHLEEKTSRRIEDLLLKEKSFKVDEMQTTLFGVCAKCISAVSG